MLAIWRVFSPHLLKTRFIHQDNHKNEVALDQKGSYNSFILAHYWSRNLEGDTFDPSTLVRFRSICLKWKEKKISLKFLLFEYECINLTDKKFVSAFSIMLPCASPVHLLYFVLPSLALPLQTLPEAEEDSEFSSQLT